MFVVAVAIVTTHLRLSEKQAEHLLELFLAAPSDGLFEPVVVNILHYYLKLLGCTILHLKNHTLRYIVHMALRSIGLNLNCPRLKHLPCYIRLYIVFEPVPIVILLDPIVFFYVLLAMSLV